MGTLLIIDDEPRELDFLRRMLEGEGFRIEMAVSEPAARGLIDEHGERIRAVLLDWTLDGVDGVATIRWIREHPLLGGVEVVVQSAEFVPENVRAGLEHGAYYYLTKPFEALQLKAIVGAAIATCELKRELAEKIEETEDAMRLLAAGTFRFRTRRQAQLLAVHLGSAAADPQIGVGLMELLLNAVEHGNLELSYADKGRLLAADRYEEEIARRLELPEYRDRRVEVAVERCHRELEILITDAGPGFDYRRYLTMDEERLFDPHGKGMILAAAALDLEYLGRGNRVRVRFPLNS